jgi:hypothetical protein
MGVFFKAKGKIVPIEVIGEERQLPVKNNYFSDKSKPTATIIIRPKAPAEKLITKYIWMVGNVAQNRAALNNISIAFDDDGIKKELMFNKINSALIDAKQNYQNHMLTIFEVAIPESKLNNKGEYANFFLSNYITSTIDVQTKNGNVVKSVEIAPEAANQQILTSISPSMPGEYDSEASMSDIHLSPEDMPSPPASPRRN